MTAAPSNIAALTPGPATSEFKLTLATHLVAVLVLGLSAAGIHLAPGASDALVPAAALLLSAITQAAYSLSRGRVKAAWLLPVAATPTIDAGQVREAILDAFDGLSGHLAAVGATCSTGCRRTAAC